MVTEATVTDERLTTHRSSEVGGISRHQQMCLSVWSHIKTAHSSHHSTTGDISVYNEDKVSSSPGTRSPGVSSARARAAYQAQLSVGT